MVLQYLPTSGCRRDTGANQDERRILVAVPRGVEGLSDGTIGFDDEVEGGGLLHAAEEAGQQLAHLEQDLAVRQDSGVGDAADGSAGLVLPVDDELAAGVGAGAEVGALLPLQALGQQRGIRGPVQVVPAGGDRDLDPARGDVVGDGAGTVHVPVAAAATREAIADRRVGRLCLRRRVEAGLLRASVCRLCGIVLTGGAAAQRDHGQSEGQAGPAPRAASLARRFTDIVPLGGNSGLVDQAGEAETDDGVAGSSDEPVAAPVDQRRSRQDAGVGPHQRSTLGAELERRGGEAQGAVAARGIGEDDSFSP